MKQVFLTGYPCRVSSTNMALAYPVVTLRFGQFAPAVATVARSEAQLTA
jgi:hypothetical protein